MTGASLITARQLNTGADERQRRIQMFMPLMFLVFFINVQAALVLYYTTTQLYQLVQQIIMTRDMRKPGSGWRGILGMKSAVLPPPKLDRPKDPKPQVKGPSSSPAGKAPPTFDALAKRRELDEKRARQRRKKKKRKR
jgi:membrane protein insertase Oxa1/YidC/SpoIIIJ